MMFNNKKLLDRLDQMLEDGINGTFTETSYDESRLSSIESKWYRYLTSSKLSSQKINLEREKIKELVTDISHQTKTPLTNIELYTQLLQEQNLDETSKFLADEIQKQALKALCLCENDIVVLVFEIHVRCNILFRTPYRRAVFCSLPELLFVGCSHFHHKFHNNANSNSNQQINRVKRWNDMGKRCTEIVQGREYLFRNVLTLSCPERKADDVTGIAENDIGKVIENEFFYLSRIHSDHLNASFP